MVRELSFGLKVVHQEVVRELLVGLVMNGDSSF